MGYGYWVIRTYRAGAVGEKIKYWVPGEKPTKSERKIRSDIRQQQRNEASAEKGMARLIHANFSPEDYLVGLNYAAVPEGLEMDELYEWADHQGKLWAKRVRRACRAAGIPFRYISTTSDLDGKTGEVVRVHHHIIVNAEALEIALAKWTAGGTHHEHLYDQVDQTPLAHYMLAQVRHRPDGKKYSPSRNLAIPQPKDRIAVSGAELLVPRGGQLLQRAGWMPGMPQYIRYILPEVGKIRRGAVGADTGAQQKGDGGCSDTNGE